MTVRTRVAPSPTGDPHVGTAYMALFNYCFAKKHGGQFLLRIEDTDQVRSTASAEAAILKALRWTGLQWDEGPDVGGPHGPYRQSERSAIYRAHAEQLLETGHAFRCFCTNETLDALRLSQKGQSYLGYDGRCMHLSPTEMRKQMDAGAPYVVRMKVPREGTCTVQDMLRGPIALDWTQVDFQVLLKSDGLPTYHLANVVDDHLMEITHVMRGEEWLTSAPKHLLLYEYFGWQAPTLCHMPLLRNPDKSKLSKRKNPTSILYYQRMGVLPEALLNYLGQMAWSMPDGRERFRVEEMVEAFDLSRISLGGPVFDITKLFWLNGTWIREELDDTQFADRVSEWALNRDHLAPIIPLVKGRVQVFTELAPLAAYLLAGVPDIDVALLPSKKVEAPVVRKALWASLQRIDKLRDYTKEEIEAVFRDLATKFDIKVRDFLRPFYVACSGREAALPLFDTALILGKDIFRTRIRYALEKMGAPTEAEQKEWKLWLEG